MTKTKKPPSTTTPIAGPRTILRDLGKATEKTRSNYPKERYDNVFMRTKGPYLG